MASERAFALEQLENRVLLSGDTGSLALLQPGDPGDRDGEQRQRAAMCAVRTRRYSVQTRRNEIHRAHRQAFAKEIVEAALT